MKLFYPENSFYESVLSRTFREGPVVYLPQFGKAEYENELNKFSYRA